MCTIHQHEPCCFLSGSRTLKFGKVQAHRAAVVETEGGRCGSQLNLVLKYSDWTARRVRLRLTRPAASKLQVLCSQGGEAHDEAHAPV